MTWDIEYPSMEFIRDDIQKDGLYLLTLPEGDLLSAASLLPDEELNDLPFWGTEIQKPCELSGLAPVQPTNIQNRQPDAAKNS